MTHAANIASTCVCILIACSSPPSAGSVAEPTARVPETPAPEELAREPSVPPVAPPLGPPIALASCTFRSALGPDLVVSEDGSVVSAGRRVQRFTSDGVTGPDGELGLSLRDNGDVLGFHGEKVGSMRADGSFVPSRDYELRLDGQRLLRDGIRVAELSPAPSDGERRIASLAFVIASTEMSTYSETDRSPPRRATIERPANTIEIRVYPQGEFLRRTYAVDARGAITGSRNSAPVIQPDGRITDRDVAQFYGSVGADGMLLDYLGHRTGYRIEVDGSVHGTDGEPIVADANGSAVIPYLGAEMTVEPPSDACRRLLALHLASPVAGVAATEFTYGLLAAFNAAIEALAGGTTTVEGRELVDPRKAQELARELEHLRRLGPDFFGAAFAAPGRGAVVPPSIPEALGFDPRRCLAQTYGRARAIACSSELWPVRPVFIELSRFASVRAT
jgi:hypothetical protein